MNLMNAWLFPGDMVIVKQHFFIFGKEISHDGSAFIERDNVLLIITVKKCELNASLMSLYTLCSKTGQLGWTHVSYSKIDKVFSVLAHA